MPIPDFDDIIFENLNREYGAYPLRKNYNRVVILSVVLATLLGGLAVLIPYLIKEATINNEALRLRYITVENLMTPIDNSGAPKGADAIDYSRAKAPAASAISKVKNVAPVIVDSLPREKQTLHTETDSIANSDNTGASGDHGDGTGVLNGRGGSGGGTGDGLYSEVDMMPTFRGGDIEKFREWVRKKTKYPREAAINGIMGKVYVSFVVDMDGSVVDVKVVKGVDPLIDDEALKTIISSPKWTPGRLSGRIVRVIYNISLNFEL